VDVRLVAATNKDLKKESEEGTFREDLFYRLAVVPIHVPSLAERLQDVPELCAAFLSRFATELGRAVPRLTEDALRWLQRQSWPGNVRQLKNTMERAAILVEGPTIDARDLEQLLGPPATGAAADVFRSATTFAEFQDLSEKLFLQQRLAENGWNVKRTAEVLGMQRSNLYKKIERYGLK
jgi:two-component system nitrogen regulation response regulator NtrX